MPVMNVNPTRMELTNLKKKLITARKGHKLLKDKRDELMRQFLELARENRELRLKIEQSVKIANVNMVSCRSSMSDEQLGVALLMPSQSVSIDISEKNIMGVVVPQFDAKFKIANRGDIYSYGFAFTGGELDGAVKAYSDILPDMIRLAEIEKTCQLLAMEIEKIRRRVNALEHVIIPQYTDTIKYISMKLEEADRSNTTRLLKIKDMMLQDARK